MLFRLIKRWLFNFVVGDLFNGITEYDFVDIELLDGGERTEYLLQGRDVNKNTTFQTEVLRMKFMLEKKIVRNAKSDFDILVGKAQLILLDQLMNRFEALSEAHNREKYMKSV